MLRIWSLFIKRSLMPNNTVTASCASWSTRDFVFFAWNATRRVHLLSKHAYLKPGADIGGLWDVLCIIAFTSIWLCEWETRHANIEWDMIWMNISSLTKICQWYTIQYHSIPFNTIQYHWGLQWYTGRSQWFPEWYLEIPLNTTQYHWGLQWYTCRSQWYPNGIWKYH